MTQHYRQLEIKMYEKNNRKLTQIPIKVLRNKFWTSNPTDIKNCVYISF